MFSLNATATRQLMDYTERVLRQRIAEIPDGEYRAEGFLDDDGRNRDVRLPIKVCVRVEGDGIESGVGRDLGGVVHDLGSDGRNTHRRRFRSAEERRIDPRAQTGMRAPNACRFGFNNTFWTNSGPN